MASADGHRVINLLECPACHQTMVPPIFLCEAGHNVCSRCRGQTPNCPYCDVRVTGNRNRLAETFAEKLPYSCVNQNVGCRQKFLLRDLAFHEAACPHRLYCCVPCRPRCKWRGRKFQVGGITKIRKDFPILRKFHI